MTPPVRATERKPRKPPVRKNQFGETPDEADKRVQREYRSTRNVGAPGSWLFTCSEATLFGLIADLIKPPQLPGQRTKRQLPDVEEGRTLIRSFFDKSHTTMPFRDIFPVLYGSLSVRQIADRTGISKYSAHQLMRGVREPTMAELEAIAPAFGKDPRYFIEYRASIIAQAVFTATLGDPDRSAVIVKQMAAG